jgi:hypothetical protein
VQTKQISIAKQPRHKNPQVMPHSATLTFHSKQNSIVKRASNNNPQFMPNLETLQIKV